MNRFFHHILFRGFSEKQKQTATERHLNFLHNKSNILLLFLRGEDHLKRRSSAACRAPRLPTLLGCAPHTEIGRVRENHPRYYGISPHSACFLRWRGENSLRVSTRPVFYISANPGRGAGEPPRARLSEFQRSPGGGAGEPPRAQLSEPRQPREGSGEGSSARPRAALPNAPKRRVVAARRASSRGMRGVGGATPTIEGFSPHILHQRLQLKVHSNST